MAIPQISGVLGLILYNLVDTYYVGRLGRDQLAAMSFTFPVVMVVGALAQGLGQGASAVISRTIGEGDNESTKRLATHAMLMALVLVFSIATVGVLTIDPLFRLLGARDDILPYIRDYMEVWYPAVMFIIMTMVGNHILRSTGEVRLPAYIMLIAAGLNALLDPLLIFGLGPFPALGIRGAAVATAIARSLTLVVSLGLLFFREKLIYLGRGMFSKGWQSFRDIMVIAAPISGTRLIVPLGAGVVTRLVAQYGTPAVAGYGVAHRMEVFALSFVNSLSVVVGPFIGQNMGAGRNDRVKEAFAASTKFCFLVGFASFGVFLVIPEPIVRIFNQDPQVVAAASLYVRVVSAAYAFQGIFMVSTAGLNVLRKPMVAAALGLIQMFGLTIPLGIVLDRFFGLPGLFGAISASYVISGLLSFRLTRGVLDQMMLDMHPSK